MSHAIDGVNVSFARGPGDQMLERIGVATSLSSNLAMLTARGQESHRSENHPTH
jgi:hypothetical protein